MRQQVIVSDDADTPITAAQQGVIDQHAEAIRILGKRTVHDIIEIGRRLAEVKKQIGRGSFLPWIEREFGWSEDTAERFIALHALQRQLPQVAELNLPFSGLYALASPSTPLEAVKAVVVRAEDGERVSVAEVKATIQEVKVGKVCSTSRPSSSRQAEKKGRREARERELAAAPKRASRNVKEKFYGVIYADLPWRFEPYNSDTETGRAGDNYPTLSTEEFRALPVPAAEDAVLFLWATAPMLPQALDLMGAWGFAYKSLIVWDKERENTGCWVRNRVEILLVGTRGTVSEPKPGEQPPQLIAAACGRHSEKPHAFAEHIERLFPNVPRLELFAREARPGWDAWGNETQRPIVEEQTAEAGDGLDIPDFLRRDKWLKAEPVE